MYPHGAFCSYQGVVMPLIDLQLNESMHLRHVQHLDIFKLYNTFDT